MKLNELKLNEVCIIKVIEGKQSHIRRRLLEMGLTPGTKVKFVGPENNCDPMILYLRNFNLAIRKEEASWVTIEKI